MRTLPLLTVLASSATLVACGAASNATDPQSTAASTPAAMSSTPSSSTTAPQDAAGIIAAMAQRDSHLTASVTYTATTDENHLLGRPGQYTSKSTFTDDQISTEDKEGYDPGDIDLGGGIEAFANAKDTQSRAQYIAAISQSGGLFAEYDYVSGTALLRVSHYLTPEQAAVVEADFSAVTGQPAAAATAP